MCCTRGRAGTQGTSVLKPCLASWHCVRKLYIGYYHLARVYKESRIPAYTMCMPHGDSLCLGRSGVLCEQGGPMGYSVRTFLNMMLFSWTRFRNKEVPWFRQQCFLSGFDMIDLMFTSLALIFLTQILSRHE